MKKDFKPTILLAADHAGFELKNQLVEFVRGMGYEVHDMGANAFDVNDDYPGIMAPVGFQVAGAPDKVKAIILGGSGQGEAMVANRFPGVRAVVYYGQNLEIVKLSREHNDANVLSLGARFVNAEQAKEAVKLWLDTPFSGEERHSRRIEQIDNIE
jgi:ribose 5-phosphate isomerase B